MSPSPLFRDNHPIPEVRGRATGSIVRVSHAVVQKMKTGASIPVRAEIGKRIPARQCRRQDRLSKLAGRVLVAAQCGENRGMLFDREGKKVINETGQKTSP